jgi:hypothetical protein
VTCSHAVVASAFTTVVAAVDANAVSSGSTPTPSTRRVTYRRSTVTVSISRPSVAEPRRSPITHQLRSIGADLRLQYRGLLVTDDPVINGDRRASCSVP